HITSAARYDIELASGRRLFGSLTRGDVGTVVVETPLGQERLSLGDIVRLTPLGGTFWRRLDGSFEAAFIFTEANVQTQWTFNGKISYRTRQWLSGLTADSLLTSSED